jgi:hypothetical protein
MALVINLLSVESFDSWSKILDRIYRSPYNVELKSFTSRRKYPRRRKTSSLNGKHKDQLTISQIPYLFL